jgi:hypothetical protein
VCSLMVVCCCSGAHERVGVTLVHVRGFIERDGTNARQRVACVRSERAAAARVHTWEREKCMVVTPVSTTRHAPFLNRITNTAQRSRLFVVLGVCASTRSLGRTCRYKMQMGDKEGLRLRNKGTEEGTASAKTVAMGIQYGKQMCSATDNGIRPTVGGVRQFERLSGPMTCGVVMSGKVTPGRILRISSYQK